MDYQTIRFEKRDGIGYLTLHRPDKLNAISRDMLADCGMCCRRSTPMKRSAWLSSLAPAGPFSAGLTLARRATARSTNSMRMSGGNTSRKI